MSDIISKFGSGDQLTLAILNKSISGGHWLNLAAGDGRYNNILLDKVNSLVAADYNASELEILSDNAPLELKDKLETVVFDIKNKFPFPDNYFDGVWCTGTLHLFSESDLANIFQEIDRVLRVDGRIIFDFATNIHRIMPDGNEYKFPGEVGYTTIEARELLSAILSKYNIEVVESDVPPEKIIFNDVSYIYQSDFLLMIATKSN